MGRKAKYSKALKLKIIKRYIKGESASALASEYNMPNSMDSEIIKWANKYKEIGESAFDELTTNKSYPKELKEKVIKDYLNGINSLEGLAN